MNLIELLCDNCKETIDGAEDGWLFCSSCEKKLKKFKNNENKVQKLKEKRKVEIDKSKKKVAKRGSRMRKNELLQLIRRSNRFGSMVNVFRYHVGNTPRHEDLKYEVFKFFRRKGYDVLVEPIFENNARADVLILDQELVIECLDSEKDENLVSKRNYYPKEFRIVGVRTDRGFSPDDFS